MTTTTTTTSAATMATPITSASPSAAGIDRADTHRATATSGAAPRLDIYAPIHRAWRALMADTLMRAGRLDVDDAVACADTLAQVRLLCAQLRRHVAHENDFVHPAMEAVAPGSSGRIGHEHDEHLDAIASIEDQVQAIEQAPAARRMALARELYRALARLMADNLLHMDVEEREHNAVLWAHHRDDELQALDGRIVASLPPDEAALGLQWMARALPPQDLAALLAGARAGMPPEAFAGMLALARDAMDAPTSVKVMRMLGLQAA